MPDVMAALGLMSGTSMDGIDVALIETDGVDVVTRRAAASYPYRPPMREKLQQALVDAKGLADRRSRPGCLADVERELTDLHAEVVETFCADNNVPPRSVNVIGFHGHTVWHDPGMPGLRSTNGAARSRPERLPRQTVQIGDGQHLADLTGIDVIYDLRAADLAAGGQAAPLAPVYHRARVSRIAARPIAVVNVGGVANVTWIGRDGTLLAFDTGPGNALLDDWMSSRAGVGFDAEGQEAARGRVDEDALHTLLASPFFGMLLPKSLDRNAFDTAPVRELNLRDGAATLTAFTAASIAKAREHFPEEPQLWIISGGGRRNRTLMSMLAERVTAAVAPAEAVNLDGDSLEAEAWAYMAVRSLKGLAITFPGTTGVPSPTTGGVLAKSRRA